MEMQFPFDCSALTPTGKPATDPEQAALRYFGYDALTLLQQRT